MNYVFDEIVNKYERFSDSVILEIAYRMFENVKTIQVTIKCMNRLNNYEFETVKLIFEDIISIRFIENENTSSMLVNAALLKNLNGIIIFDFSH